MYFRVGTPAADFQITTQEGTNTTLYQIRNEYVLLFFGVPDCQECRQTKTYIDHSSVFEKWIKEQKRVTVVAVYAQDDPELFKTAQYPKEWINGCHLHLQQSQIYDLKASPTLYLLDKEHRVLLKEVTAEEIERFLQEADQ